MRFKRASGILMSVVSTLACNLIPATPSLEPAAPTVTTLTETPIGEPTTEATDEPTLTDEPTATSAPLALAATPDLTGPDYGVVMVREGDVLNVRSGPGVGNPVVATFPPIFAAIKIMGQGVHTDDGALWVPVQRLETSGWINRYFLTEVVFSDDFCADPAAEMVVDATIAAVETQDGGALAALVQPDRGLHIRLNWWNEEVHLSLEEVSSLFTDDVERFWGNGMGSGEPINGTAREIVVPRLEADLLAPTAERACNQILAGNTTGLVQVPPEYTGFNYYSVYRPAVDNEDNSFDWGSWVIGIEYWDGPPHLVYLIHYEWEI